jgi:hypothetical protein
MSAFLAREYNCEQSRSLPSGKVSVGKLHWSWVLNTEKKSDIQESPGGTFPAERTSGAKLSVGIGLICFKEEGRLGWLENGRKPGCRQAASHMGVCGPWERAGLVAFGKTLRRTGASCRMGRWDEKHFTVTVSLLSIVPFKMGRVLAPFNRGTGRLYNLWWQWFAEVCCIHFLILKTKSTTCASTSVLLVFKIQEQPLLFSLEGSRER